MGSYRIWSTVCLGSCSVFKTNHKCQFDSFLVRLVRPIWRRQSNAHRIIRSAKKIKMLRLHSERENYLTFGRGSLGTRKEIYYNRPTRDPEVWKMGDMTLYRTKRTEHWEWLFASVRVRQDTNLVSVRFAQCTVRFCEPTLGVMFAMFSNWQSRSSIVCEHLYSSSSPIPPPLLLLLSLESLEVWSSAGENR
jgi:hypothetical protein